MKFFSKIWVKSNVLKYLVVNHEIMGFFRALTGRQLFPSPYTFLQTSHFPYLSKKSFKQTKEVTFARRLANISGPLVRGSYCHSSQKLMKKGTA